MVVMSLLMTWTWPETPIVIAVIVVIGVVAHALVVFAVSRATSLALKRSAEHASGRTNAAARLLGQASGLARARAEQRTKTLGSLLRSVSGVVLTIVVLLTVLSEVGIPLAPLLASAGVGGIALAFGAQSLVKDYLTGIFMIMEDQYGVGDFITVGDVSGTVQEVTLRVTRIQDPSGKVWYVRNGEITQVGNISQGYSTVIVPIPVAYDANPEQVLTILQEAAAAIGDDPDWANDLIEAPNVLGVGDITAGALTFQVLLKTHANQQWGVQRAFRQRAKEALSAAGVQGPTLEALGS